MCLCSCENFANPAAGIGQDWEGRPAIHHFGDLVVSPHVVNKYAVDAHRQKLDPQLLNGIAFFGNCRNYSCSGKREVTRIKTKQYIICPGISKV